MKNYPDNYLELDRLFSGDSENFFLLSFVFSIKTFMDKSLIKQKIKL